MSDCPVFAPLAGEEFTSFWREMAAQAAKCRAFTLERVNIAAPAAEYALLRFTAADGAPLRARYIRPAGGGAVPVVLQFHDFGRGARGWHHLTRYAALGYGVVALENRRERFDLTRGFDGAPEELTAVRLLADALSCAYAASELPGTDPRRLAALGDGFGGGQAIAAAALVPCERCAVLNPQPLDIRTAWEEGFEGGVYQGIRPYFRDRDAVHRTEDALFRALDYADCARFAPALSCRLLLGTSLMNEVSPPEAQAAFFQAAGGPKRRLCYPKYGHERINFFENEVLKFLLE